MKVDWKWLAVGYLVGSFFGLPAVLSLVGGGRSKAAAQ